MTERPTPRLMPKRQLNKFTVCFAFMLVDGESQMCLNTLDVLGVCPHQADHTSPVV